MTWKRHKQTNTRATWYEGDGCMIQMTSNGWYECWVNDALVGECGALGEAKNLCEIHSNARAALEKAGIK